MIAVLPGVPREMNAMLVSHVAPELNSRFSGGEVKLTRRVMTFGAGESDVARLLSDLIGASDVQYGFLVMAGPIVVKLTARAETGEEAARLLDEEEGRVRERLRYMVYAVDDEPMEKVVGDMLRRGGLTLAVAESCTGGMIGGRITNVPGSSDYFLGGVVSYSVRSKADVLGLDGDVLAEGTVSTRVAEAMAESVRKMFGASIGVGVTGIAGPGGGTEEKPVGTVCLGIAHDEGVQSATVRLPGDRPMIRSITTMGAMNMVRLYLLGRRISH
jgi:nicotinamide-nucleotide amidase